MNGFTWRRSVVLAAVLLLLSAGGAFAQLQVGDLYGSVIDNQGAALPGARVTLTGIGAPRTQFSNAEGQFRFLGLNPGNYELVVELDGFSTVEYPSINIRVGASTTIEATLTPAVEDVITVTSESPLLDERKVNQGTTVTELELEKIPTARDPWSVLSQAPGVVTDRINVGGNESGQQAVFVGTGANSDQNAFAVDGVTITDMSAVGSSPTYYDFDSFEEVQLTTGGSDISVASSGVTVNVVTKRGTNEWRGSGRFFRTDSSWQSDPNLSSSDFPASQDINSYSANSINEIEDKGLELGGPVIKDRLWVWGAYGENDIKNIVAGGGADDTILESYNVKFNAQLASPNSAVFQFSRGDKLKFGRGASISRPDPTTWNQSGPTEIWKLEDTHVFNSNFYLTGLYSYVDGGFALSPKGGLGEAVVWDETGTWQNSYLDYSTVRPADQYKLDGSYFFNTGSMNHELRFGASYRKFEVFSTSVWPGNGVINVQGENFGINGNREIAIVTRDGNAAFDTEYNGLWLQDTLTTGNLTANIGLRYDKQSGVNLPSTINASPFADRFLPTLDFQGNDPNFDWTSVSPRLSATYALGDERKTLLRASYSRFAQQLATGYTSIVNPLAPSSVYYFFTDTNGDKVAQAGELDANPFRFGNTNPNNPTQVGSLNQIDPNLDPSLTDEIIFGVEHAFLPEFVVGVNATYRNITDIIEARQLIFDETGALRVATSDDYILDGTVTGTLPDGSTYNEPYFALRPGLSTSGASRTVNGSREQDYLGLSVQFTKRLANRWMARGHVTWYDWTWNVPADYQRFSNPTDSSGPSDNDGAVVAEQSGGSGSKGDLWLHSSWSANLNALYQVAPDRAWGFNLATNINAREGFVSPYFHRQAASDGQTLAVAVSDFDRFRNDDIFTVDLRVDKDFEFGDWGFTVSVDGFNLFNEATVLQRQRNLTVSTANHVRETLSPRVFRLGLRLHFR